ncbi:MAG: hypothetical protein HC788_05085 [Sphingopyxis sp.]|nr:hypothetical protein [Sphingopyxis sp.]
MMRQSWGNNGRFANRRLERASNSVGLSWVTYGYDNSDNITQIADSLNANKTRSFGYDPVERLTRKREDMIGTLPDIRVASEVTAYSPSQ